MAGVVDHRTVPARMSALSLRAARIAGRAGRQASGWSATPSYSPGLGPLCGRNDGSLDLRPGAEPTVRESGAPMAVAIGIAVEPFQETSWSRTPLCTGRSARHLSSSTDRQWHRRPPVTANVGWTGGRVHAD